MKMTEEMARRIMDRARTLPSKLPDEHLNALLIDWLEGITHKELQAKYNIGRSQVGHIIKQFRADARVTLKVKV